MNQMNLKSAALIAATLFSVACGQQNGQQGSFCQKDTDCVSGSCNLQNMVCNAGPQQPTNSCTTDADCKNGQHCDVNAKQCVNNGNPNPSPDMGGNNPQPDGGGNNAGPVKTYTIEFVGIPSGSSPNQRYCDGRPYERGNTAANGGFRNWPSGSEAWQSFGNDVYRLPTAYASSATLYQSDALRFQCRDVNLTDGKVVETYGCDSSRGIVPVVKLNGRQIGLVLVPNLAGGMNCQTTE